MLCSLYSSGCKQRMLSAGGAGGGRVPDQLSVVP